MKTMAGKRHIAYGSIVGSNMVHRQLFQQKKEHKFWNVSQGQTLRYGANVTKIKWSVAIV